MIRVALVLLMILAIAPMYFMYTGSLTTISGLFLMPPRLWPVNPTLRNYETMLPRIVNTWYVNSIVVVGLIVVVSVCTAVSAGYVFAVYGFPFKRSLWVFLMLGILIPRMSMIVPLFVVTRRLGIIGTVWGAALPAAFMPMSLYIARAYFESIPVSILEAARIDGAGDLSILTRIVAPMSRPIVTACALFAAIHGMQDFMWQMLQLQRTERQTFLVGIVREGMRRGGGVEVPNPIGQMFASAVLLSIPLLAVFFIANKYFTSALGGAIKG